VRQRTGAYGLPTAPATNRRGFFLRAIASGPVKSIFWPGLSRRCGRAANTSLLVNIERNGGQQNERMHRRSSPRPGQAAAKVAPRAAHEARPRQGPPNEPGFHKKGENSTKEGMKTRLRDHSARRGAASRPPCRRRTLRLSAEILRLTRQWISGKARCCQAQSFPVTGLQGPPSAGFVVSGV